jgi:hypothetical protein
MKNLSNLIKLNLLVFALCLVMFIVVISCFRGGRDGGSIIPPVGGGGSGGGSGTAHIDMSRGYLIIENNGDAPLLSGLVSFNFQTSNPNILSNQNNNDNNVNMNILDNLGIIKCGLIPSNEDNVNNNILYTRASPPTLGERRFFEVVNYRERNVVTVEAKCVYVNNRPRYAIWVDTNNTDTYNEEALFNANRDNVISRFNNDYRTLSVNAIMSVELKPFYVDILITEKAAGVLGYFWGDQDWLRVNIHPVNFHPDFNYGTYNEFNVTLAHEFVHLLEFNKNNNRRNHEPWITEGLATYGEFLCGYSARFTIDCIKSFLYAPDTTSLVTNNVGLPNYGKSVLFIKQLNQRFTSAWADMLGSNLDGINLIENINGSEDFQTTVDKFNIAVLIDTNDNNLTYDFIGLDLNSDTFNNGIRRYNGWNNTTLNEMGAANPMKPYTAYYLYKNSAFNGSIFISTLFEDNIQLLFNPFVNRRVNEWRIKYNRFNNNVRFILLYNEAQ